MTITLEQAKERHGDLVTKMQDECAKKLKRSKNKNKGKDISELVWSYKTATLIRGGGSLAYVLSSAYDKHDTSIDAQVADEVSRTSVDLFCEMPGAWARENVTGVPQEIVDNIKKHIEKQEQEKARLDALTPEQRQEEFQGLLKQLGKSKGFMML